MKKNARTQAARRQLRLHRETLLSLDPASARWVVGAETDDCMQTRCFSDCKRCCGGDEGTDGDGTLNLI